MLPHVEMRKFTMRNQFTQAVLAITVEIAFTLAMAFGAGVMIAHWGSVGHEPIGTTVAGSIAGGVLGNFVYRLLNLSSIFIGRLMITDQDTARLPANHHIARGIRGALISGVVAVAHEGIAAAARRNPEADVTSERLIWRAAQMERDIGLWARQERRNLDWGPAGGCMSRSVTMASRDLTDLVDPGPTDPASDAERHALWAQVGAAMVQELNAGLSGPLAAELKAVLEGQTVDGFSFTYLDAVSGYFIERAKKDPVLFRATNLYLLAAQLKYIHRPAWKPRLA